MKKRNLKILAVTILFVWIATPLLAQNGSDILKKVDAVMYASQDMTAVNKIELTNRSGQKDYREATVAQKGTSYRIFRFTQPASQAGISVLSLPGDIMYLYMPAFGKVRRVSSSIKNQNFAGTDFSYDDMEAKPFLEKYEPKFLREEAGLYYLELIPRSDRSAYSKVILSVNRKDYFPVQMTYYDKGNHEVKVADYKFVKIGKYWNAEQITMKDLKKQHTTALTMTKVKYDNGLTNDDFTVRKLEQ